MKNLSLVLNIVLLVAVSVLYYLHFSAKGSKSSSSTTAPAGDLTIAYINSDSVLKHYDFLTDNKVILEAKTKKLGSDLRNRAQALQSEIGAYQRNVSNMTIGQAKALEEDLTKKQQNLQMYEQSLNQQMMEEQEKLNRQLYDRITSYLKTYSEQNGLQMVLKLDTSSDVLYGKDGLDITKTVVDGLNEAYVAEKGGSKAKADSLTKK
jgi:outer membrane protein